eukprot:m.208217 g.208217  ORF g.208217 m.208217 type:complete len:418 (-) comp17798_c1_seq1:4634-5887(-)
MASGKTAAATATAQLPSLIRNAGLSVYVHVPWCAKICSYCDFNKYKQASIPWERYIDCLKQELEWLLQRAGPQTGKLPSLYFGGGTPSLAPPALVTHLTSCLGEHSLSTTNAEITLEANPTSASRDALMRFRDAGITRLSLGVQTFNKRGLSILGRDHSPKEAQQALENALEVFGDAVTLDLIFGWPQQTLQEWQEDLAVAAAFAPAHMSVYELTFKAGTPLHTLNKEKKVELPEELLVDMFHATDDALEAIGLERYEVSSFARPGREGRHNMHYWSCGQFLGIGPGAHGRWQSNVSADGNGDSSPALVHTVQTASPKAWFREVESRGHGTRLERNVLPSELRDSCLVLGLRTARGVDAGRWLAITGKTLADTFADSPAFRELQTQGLVELDAAGLRVRRKGRLLIDGIAARLAESL